MHAPSSSSSSGHLVGQRGGHNMRSSLGHCSSTNVGGDSIHTGTGVVPSLTQANLARINNANAQDCHQGKMALQQSLKKVQSLNAGSHVHHHHHQASSETVADASYYSSVLNSFGAVAANSSSSGPSPMASNHHPSSSSSSTAAVSSSWQQQQQSQQPPPPPSSSSYYR